MVEVDAAALLGFTYRFSSISCSVAVGHEAEDPILGCDFGRNQQKSRRADLDWNRIGVKGPVSKHTRFFFSPVHRRFVR